MQVLFLLLPHQFYRFTVNFRLKKYGNEAYRNFWIKKSAVFADFRLKKYLMSTSVKADITGSMILTDERTSETYPFFSFLKLQSTPVNSSTQGTKKFVRISECSNY